MALGSLTSAALKGGITGGAATSIGGTVGDTISGTSGNIATGGSSAGGSVPWYLWAAGAFLVLAVGYRFMKKAKS